MVSNFLTRFSPKIRKWLNLLLFLTLSTIILLLASMLLFNKESSVDILLVFIIWCLPLFIH
jgi:hypothetical protein